MLTVTSKAKNKLKEALKNEKPNDNTFIRIASTSEIPGGVGFMLDNERNGDEIIYY